SVSRERLFDVFLDFLDPLGDLVDVVLETSHNAKGGQHLDLYREHIDLPILKSHCCEFDDLLLNDGCAGIAVLSSNQPTEVQFDEHKLLIIYAAEMRPFTTILAAHGVMRKERMKLITEAEHLHSTGQRFRSEFDQFCFRLGVGEAVERVSW